MADDSVRLILDALATATGVPVGMGDQVDPRVQAAICEALGDSDELPIEVELDGYRFIAQRVSRGESGIVVLGPYRRPSDPVEQTPVLDGEGESRARAVLGSAVLGAEQILAERSQQREAHRQLEVIGTAVTTITSELDLDTVLDRIVNLAREVVDAEYAALGVPDGRGGLERFLHSGISDEDAAKIGHLPHGRGILGLLLSEPQSIRISDLTRHPKSYGFPPNHPPMRSFLGVPIMARGRVLGNLYLTEKRSAPEFTVEDEQLIELVARQAAVAIENAHLYAQLDTQQRRLQVVIDQLPEAVVIVERDPERVTLANRRASALLGWDIGDVPLSLEEFIERNPRHRADGTRLPLEEVPVVRSLRNGEIVSLMEIQLGRPDGSRLTLLNNAAPLLDEREEIIGAVVTFQDISRIKDAEQLKDDFLSLVSHELRTPLTTIHGGAHLLLTSGEQLDAESRHDLLADIVSESGRLAHLVENMVQLANIRAGRLAIETEPVLAREIVDRAATVVQAVDPERPVTVNAARGLLALGDPNLMDQALRNVLQNALKYSPPRSPVEISVEPNNGMVVFAVRDYGPGFDADLEPSDINRFHRGNRARVSGVSGMGLGLYLVKNIVETHGGTIWFERPDGGGARVLFSVPRIVEES